MTPEIYNLIDAGNSPEDIARILNEKIVQNGLDESSAETFPDEILMISQALAYRTATIQDSGAIRNLINLAYQDETCGQESFRIGETITVDIIKSLLEQSDYRWILAEAPDGRGVEDDGMLLGICCYTIDGISRKNGIVEGNLGSVRYLCVRPKYRGLCLGFRILQKVELLMANSCVRIMICVPNKRTSMCRWLEKKKFQFAGISYIAKRILYFSSLYF